MVKVLLLRTLHDETEDYAHQSRIGAFLDLLKVWSVISNYQEITLVQKYGQGFRENGFQKRRLSCLRLRRKARLGFKWQFKYHPLLLALKALKKCIKSHKKSLIKKSIKMYQGVCGCWGFPEP
jgi:hypothetical protein